MNKVLVIGKGGREHALAWKFAQSSQVEKVYVAPGNKGMEDIATLVNIKETDLEGLVKFAKEENIALTVVGAELPLVSGIVDYFKKNNLQIWGPTSAAAQIEGSKSFSKNLMKKYNISTAAYEVFTNYEEACKYVETAPMPTVIKADGLAAGKGVAIVSTLNEAKATLKEMMKDAKFGEASRKVVVEEFLEGEEFSFMTFVMGKKVLPMELSRDHKRAYDNDQGPNTGGMGAYSPVPLIDDEMIKTAFEQVLQKAAKAMVDEGYPFTGFLYGGLIATANGPKTIEFNARFGDPEAEVLLPRLESDLFEVIQTMLDGGTPVLKWSEDVAVGVILAAKGYPESPETGHIIKGLDSLNPDTLVFHCGTAFKDGNYATSGGRVLIIVKKAKDFSQARKEVYAEIDKIQCDGLFYRKDIGGTFS